MKSTEQGVAPYGAQGAPPVNADVLHKYDEIVSAI